jgi:hypothetical protein
MPETKFINEIFEKDSLANFEKMLQGYRKAKQSSAWKENVDGLVEQTPNC